jgi:hypothetical protein
MGAIIGAGSAASGRRDRIDGGARGRRVVQAGGRQ